MLPAAWVLSLSGFGLLSVFFPEAWTLLAVECTAYGALVLGAAGWEAIRHKDVGLFPGMGLALATMHLLWGAAFWVGLVKGWPSQSPRH
jgi:hypothetical protein